jgi:hypothetical protein
LPWAVSGRGLLNAICTFRYVFEKKSNLYQRLAYARLATCLIVAETRLCRISHSVFTERARRKKPNAMIIKTNPIFGQRRKTPSLVRNSETTISGTPCFYLAKTSQDEPRKQCLARLLRMRRGNDQQAGDIKGDSQMLRSHTNECHVQRTQRMRCGHCTKIGMVIGFEA